MKYVQLFQRKLVASLTLCFLLPLTFASAQSCGDFISLVPNFDTGQLEEYRQPIADCADPFSLVDGERFSNVTFSVNDEVLEDGDVITTDEFPLQFDLEVTFQGTRGFVTEHTILYFHEGNDYRQYTTSGSFIDQPGTYTAVHTIEELPQPVYSPVQWLKDLLIPTAHAQSFGPEPLERTAVTFTVELAQPEPTGASSVLFLPGIMGSRLYEKGQQCGDLGDEQERWFSVSACEQLRLLTKFDGTSLHDIYTKAADEAVIDKIVFFSLYNSFLESMNDLEETGIIADFMPFAYDWRLQLDDLLKTTNDSATSEVRFDPTTELANSHLYQTVQAMVDDSHNGKVTIVAHSNGGLLAKTFMSALQAVDDPLAEKIDSIILVAVPQVGTPDALVSMLHGSEIVGGYVASQSTTRRLLNTAPFGHHLLPNQNYFVGPGVEVLTPVISFEVGSSTNEWIDTFGSEITDSETMYQFLSKDSERVKPATDDLYHPEIVDNFLLNYANTIATVIEDWTPNPDTQVYQIAGTGIETLSGITYFTDTECIKGGLLWFECRAYAPKLGYYLNTTFDGDKTVAVPSALAMKEADMVQRLWLDLEKAGGVHNDVLEVPELVTFIEDIVQSTSTPTIPQYFSSSQIDKDGGSRLNFFLLSPLDMYLQSSDGITSSSTDEIPGATYRQYGEVQYVSVPTDSTGVTLQLRGYQNGSFTLLVQEKAGKTLVNRHDFTAVPTGTSTIVQLSLDDIQTDVSLEIDFDGDGGIDGLVSAETDIVTPLQEPAEVDVQPDSHTEEKLSSSQTTATRVRQTSSAPAREVAGIAISADHQWYYEELQQILGDIAALLILIEAQYEK